MTNDLVRRLREEADCYRGKTQSCLTDAADRIEERETQIRKLNALLSLIDLLHPNVLEEVLAHLEKKDD